MKSTIAGVGGGLIATGVLGLLLGHVGLCGGLIGVGVVTCWITFKNDR